MPQNTKTPDPPPPAPAAVAVALLRQEWPAALLASLALALPALLKIVFSLSPLLFELPLALIQRVLELAALYFWGFRCLRSLAPGAWRWSFRSLALMLVVGTLLWGALTLPFFLVRVLQSVESRSFALTCLIVATVCAYLYYFYFFPLILNGAHPLRALAHAREYLRGDPYLPLRIEVPTFSLMLLVTGLILIPYPDGREILSSLLAACAQPLAWLLSSFLGIAYGLRALSAEAWRSLQLDPYRSERLDSLAKRGSGRLAALLELRAGALLLMISLPLWGANLLRVIRMPPSAAIELRELRVDQEKVRLMLNVRDERYALRGFDPMLFTLAGEHGTLVSPPPQEVRVRDHNRDIDGRRAFPRDAYAHTIELVFVPLQPAEQLKKLTDIHLWYRGARIMRLDFGKPDPAEVPPLSATAAPFPVQ